VDYFVLDTDVASLGYRGHLPVEIGVHLVGKRGCVTFVTVGELAKGIHLRNWGLRSQVTFEAWLSGFTVIDSDYRTAQIWGRLTADGKRKGRTRPVNDTWIAACCLAWGLPLATLNRKDFADLTSDGLQLIEPL
jgi:toxin FitB